MEDNKGARAGCVGDGDDTEPDDGGLPPSPDLSASPTSYLSERASIRNDSKDVADVCGGVAPSKNNLSGATPCLAWDDKSSKFVATTCAEEDVNENEHGKDEIDSDDFWESSTDEEADLSCHCAPDDLDKDLEDDNPPTAPDEQHGDVGDAEDDNEERENAENTASTSDTQEIDPSQWVVPAKPDLPEEEGRYIKTLFSRYGKLKEGETWCLISTSWFNQWKSYTRFELSSCRLSQLSPVPKPGPIDNTTFLEEDTNVQEIPIVKRDCTETVGYDIVPYLIWKVLHTWYNGGPEVRRKVTKFSGYQTSLMVEVSFLCVNVISSEGKKPVKLFFSRQATIGDLRNVAVAALKLEDKKVKMWDYVDQRKFRELTDVNRKLENNIINDQLVRCIVLLEEENPTWPKTAYSMPSRGTAFNHDPYGFTRHSTPPEAPGLVGLQNLGNTCFMNSALQCLSNTSVLTEFFLGNEWEDDLNTTNPLGLGGKLAQEYASLVNELWRGDSRVVAPRQFKSKLEMFAPQFRGFQQHDSQELLAFLLDGLHEDLNRVKVKPYNPVPSLEGDSDAVAADKMWKLHLARNQSFIIENFQGQLKSTVICPQCKKISVTFDPFMFLSLPLPIMTRKSFLILMHTISSSIPVRYGIRVVSNTKVDAVKDSLSLLCHIPSDRILLCVPTLGKIKEVLDETVEGLAGELYGFEVSLKSEKPDYVNICILQCKKNRDTYHYASWRYECTTTMSTETVRKTNDFFGTPLVMSVPKNLHYEELCRAVLHRISFYLDADELSSCVSGENENTPATSHYCNKSHSAKEENVLVYDRGNPTDETAGPRLEVERNSQVQEVWDPVFSEEAEDEAPQTQEISYPPSNLSARDSTTSSEINPHGSNFTLLNSERSDSQDEENNQEGLSTKPECGKSSIFERLGNIFTLEKVDPITGNTLTEIKNNDSIELRDGFWLGVCWKPGKEDIYLTERKNEVQKHPSCHDINPWANEVASLTLEECLDSFTSVEKLTASNPWFCPICKRDQQATKKFDLWKLPSVLVVHLKRFSQKNSYWRERLDTDVEFPIEGLELSKWLPCSPNESFIYDLYAVSNHIGTMTGGHYTAIAKNKDSDRWINFDDSTVSPTSPQAISTSDAYLLFYKRRGVHGATSSGTVTATQTTPTTASSADTPVPAPYTATTQAAHTETETSSTSAAISTPTAVNTNTNTTTDT
ncbi:ubiquitin carboxyl-terminal hydrolase 15 [Pelomyxa schiedti]|nr:ubiquitin carboxyl-terminal hydrolase 15 [Pelomyxa schiedti]